MSREDAARGDGTSVDSADVVTADSAALARSGPSRHTWQRKAVLDQLRQCDDFVSAQRLHRLLEVSGTSIGLSTVYRQLNSLAESGLADTIRPRFDAAGADVNKVYSVQGIPVVHDDGTRTL